MRFGTSHLVYVHSFTVGLLETGGDALLVIHFAPYRLPAVVDPMRFHLSADCLHRVVGQQGDEQMTLDARCFLVVVGAQPQFALEATKDRFQISQHGIGIPEDRFIPFAEVGLYRQ